MKTLVLFAALWAAEDFEEPSKANISLLFVREKYPKLLNCQLSKLLLEFSKDNDQKIFVFENNFPVAQDETPKFLNFIRDISKGSK